MLKTLRIAGYKSFNQQAILNFACPSGNNNGSGLTLITGMNNAGKTTILEALTMKSDTMIDDDHTYENTKLQIVFDPTEGEPTTYTADGYNLNITNPHKYVFSRIGSRRNWTAEAGGGMRDNHLITNNLKEAIDLGGILNQIKKDTHGLKAQLTNMLKRVIYNFQDWDIRYRDQRLQVSYEANGKRHRADLLGDGVMSMFRICAHLVYHKDCILVIDEPELSLHPSAQKELSKIISEQASNRQVIVATHSPYFMNWQDLENGAKFVRVNKHGDKDSVLCELSNNTIQRIIGFAKDWQKPQVLDLAAKEIMFAEKLLFLEGQEDVGLIRRYVISGDKLDLKFEIFGYGVGGHGNIKFFLDLCYELGIEKAGALFDGDPAAIKSMNDCLDNKNICTLNEWNNHSGRSYVVAHLPTHDIRRKCLIRDTTNKILQDLKVGVSNDIKIDDQLKSLLSTYYSLNDDCYSLLGEFCSIEKLIECISRHSCTDMCTKNGLFDNDGCIDDNNKSVLNDLLTKFNKYFST